MLKLAETSAGRPQPAGPESSLANDEVVASAKRPRLLFVINSLAGGGAERVFTTVLRSSPRQLQAYDVHVALIDREPSAYQLPAEIVLHRLDGRGSLVRSTTQLAGLARELQPDMIISFLTRANVAASVAGRAVGCPVVISERNDTTAQLGHGRFPWLARSVVRLGYRRADRIIAVSAGIRDALRVEYGIDPSRIDVVNNPVDLEAVRTEGRKAPAVPVTDDDIVMMARLEPQKNLPTAILAFARSGRPGRLLILGEGSERAGLRALGNRLGLGDRLVLPGYVVNPFAVLARSKAFLLSSRHEGFCNSLLEAMALGVPVVASDCRFSPAEILQVTSAPTAGMVEVGEGGLLVAVDDVEAMATALRMLDEPLLYERLRQSGRQRVTDFSVARQVQSYWLIVSQTLDARSGGRP